jgi:predicted GIY-YIG superfamily endonuclease
MISEEDRDHVLYRFVDGLGQLLYVGITKNPAARLRRHGTDQIWWEQVTTIHLQRFGNRQQLLAAEKHAILHERPIYNKQCNYAEPSNGEFDIVPCPVCGRDSFYRSVMERYYHLWGDDNIECWVALSTEEVLAPFVDRHGREIPDWIIRMGMN